MRRSQFSTASKITLLAVTLLALPLVATAVPQLLYLEDGMQSGSFLKKEPPSSTSENPHELWNRSKRVPDPAFMTLNGESRKLSWLHGQVVVVNFWATWCGPCREELPRLSQLSAYYVGKPVKFVFISIDDPKDRAKIPAALARLHVSFDSWVGADTDTLGRFGLGDIVPGTIVLDENGKTVARVMGEARDEDVRKPIDWLLSGRNSEPPAALTKRY